MAHRNLQIVLKRNIAKLMQSKTPSATNDDIMQALREVQRTQTSLQEDLHHVRAGQAAIMARLNTHQTTSTSKFPQHVEKSITTSEATDKARDLALTDMREAEQDALEMTRSTEKEGDCQTKKVDDP